MDKTALVCGAGGFIGSHLVKRLKSEGFWVRGVDIKDVEFGKTEADDFIIVKYWLPDMHVGCVRADETAVGIVGYAYVTVLVIFNRFNNASIVHSHEPCCAKFRRRREGEPFRRGKPGRKIFRFLDEGGMRGSVKCVGHTFRGGDTVVLKNLEGNLINRHGLTFRAQDEISKRVYGDRKSIQNTACRVVLRDDSRT